MLLKVKGSFRAVLSRAGGNSISSFQKSFLKKNCFQFKFSQHHISKDLENQIHRTTVEAQSTAQGPQPPAREGGFPSQLQKPRSARLTLAELDTCDSVLHLPGRTQISALAQEHRNTLKPQLKSGLRGLLHQKFNPSSSWQL